MTSRERVQTVLNHKEADRVPIDFGGFGASTILAEAYHRLLEYIGVDKSIHIAETGQFLPYIDSEVKEAFSVDTAQCIPLYDGLGCRTNISKKVWAGYRNIPLVLSNDFLPKQKEDGSWLYTRGASVLKMPSGGCYFDMVEAPYKSLKTVQDLEKIDIPLFSEAELNHIKKNADMLRAGSDPFIIGEAMIGWSDIAGPWLGTETFYIDLISKPSLIHALFEKMNEVWIKKIDQLTETIGGRIDALPVYNDLGSNQGGLYSSQMVRELMIPYIRKFMDHVERVSEYHIIFHSCGSVLQYIPDLIDAGIKILNPVQIGAQGMNASYLKKEFGNDLVFWGGTVDPQHTLMFGTAREVELEAKKNIEILKKGGGFVFCNPHNIQAHIAPENIVSLFEAAKRYGSYRELLTKEEKMNKQKTMRSCMTDLNWSTFDEPITFSAASAPQDWAFIDPEAYFKYHLDFGNNIGFCQAYTFGGYAFYPSALGPLAPGPGTELLPRLYDLSKNAGLPFMSYFSVSWDLIMSNLRNEWVVPGSREVRSFGFLAPESSWTSLLCERIQEFLEMYPVDWLLLDMFLYGDLGSYYKVQPAWFVKKPFKEIIGRQMPASADEITDAENLTYKREVMARQFRAIQKTVKNTSPNTKIFFNVPYENAEEALWVDHPMMNESDALFAECSQEAVLEWFLRIKQPHQRLMTTLVGRTKENETVIDRTLTNPEGWRKWYEKGFDMFGYAWGTPPDFSPHPKYHDDLAVVRKAFAEIAAMEENK